MMSEVLVPSQRRRPARGQSLTEFILLVGLVVLAIIVALTLVRVSATTLTHQVADWFSGAGPPGEGPHDPESVAPTSSPQPTPEDLAAWLSGNWCYSDSSGTDVRVTVEQAAPGEVRITNGPDDPSADVFTIQPAGEDDFVLQSPSDRSTSATYRRVSPDGFAYVDSSGRVANVLTRCQ
jgi:hypothetical protein